MRLTERVLWCCVLAVMVVVSASCGPKYLDGLSFTRADASSSRLFVASGTVPELVDGHALVAPGARVRLGIDHRVAPGAGEDVVVVASGVGTLEVMVFGNGSREVPVVGGSFLLIAGMRAELHLAVPSGETVSFVEFHNVSMSTIRLDSLGIDSGFKGIELGLGFYRVDSSTTPRFESGRLVSAQLGAPIDAGASVVVRLAEDGVVRITGQSCATGATAGTGFEATIRAEHPLAIPRLSLDASPGATGARVESEAGIVSIAMQPGNGAPLSDLYAMLAAPAPAGDYALYRWDILPDTLLFDFTDYATQDLYLKRLAFFAEKPGFRGRLAGDAEIAPLHGWNAHDYSPRTLQAFYSLAQTNGFQLNRQELSLLDVLVKHGVLIKTSDGTLAAGRGAIVSVSCESSPALRRVFIDHESSHALFFQDATYRSLAQEMWASLDAASVRFWMVHFGWRRYDTTDRYLMYNEMQAYLVQQPVSSVKAYYETVLAQLVAAKLDQTRPGTTARLEIDAPVAIVAAEQNAARLDGYLRNHWGISGGRFGRTRRIGVQ